MNQKKRGNLALLGTGFLFGASSPLAKLLSPYLSAFGAVGVRFLFSLPFVLASIFFQKEKLQVNKNTYKKLLFFGIIFPISVIFYTLALFHTKVSLAIFSFYVSNLVSSLIFGKIFFKEKFNFLKKIAFVLSLIAIFVFTQSYNSFVFDIGMMFGYISGFIQTIASYYQKRYSSHLNEQTLLFAQTVGGIFLGVGVAFLVGDFGIFVLPFKAIAVAAIFGFIAFLINLSLLYGFKRADIATGTILMSTELIFGPAIAFIIFSELLSLNEIVAGLLIMAATILATKKD